MPATLKGLERNQAIASVFYLFCFVFFGSFWSPKVALKAFTAGCDIILAMDGAAMPAIANKIVEAAGSDPLVAQRVEQS